MKINKNYIIGGALIAGGGLYYAYTKGLLDKFIKPKPKAETAKEESQDVINTAKQEQKAIKTAEVKKAVTNAAITAITTSLSNPKSLESKVKKLQGLLKVGTDIKTYMNPNSATNKALAATYGLDKGVVSVQNVDYYISKVTSKNTLVKQSIVAKQAGNPKATAAAINNKGTIRMLRDVNAPNLVKNKATGGFTSIGTNLLFKKNAVLGSGWTAIARANTNDVVITKNGTTFQQIPANSIVII
jgi:hypothetical protein